jgi:UDP-glucose 4-epimerase
MLFQAAATAGVGTVVFASSGGSVYGQVRSGALIKESHSTQPVSPHGLLKVMTELALSHVCRTSGQTGISLRPGNVYGPGQQTQPSFGVVPTFAGNLRAGRPSEIWGAETVRDYVYVEDAAEAFVTAALRPSGQPAVVNVGTGVGHTALEVYSMLQESLGLTAPVNVVPRPASDPAWNVLDPSLLKESLGLAATVDLRDGLKRTVSSDVVMLPTQASVIRLDRRSVSGAPNSTPASAPVTLPAPAPAPAPASPPAAHPA